MPKESVREQLAIIRMENKHQTSSIEDLTATIKEHIISFNKVGQKVERHSTDISWLKKLSYGLGATITGILIWVLSSYITG